MLIDVQGFRDQHRFICKEFALIDGDFTYHAIVKSPYSLERLSEYYLRQARWAENHFHGLHYNSGDVNIIEVISKVYPKIINKQIIVRHPWKIYPLKYIFRNCGKLDCLLIDQLELDVNLPNKKVYEICRHHDSSRVTTKQCCALFNTLEMNDIVKYNQDKDKYLDKVSTLFETGSLDMDWTAE